MQGHGRSHARRAGARCPEDGPGQKQARGLGQPLLHPSDRGSQYACQGYRKRLAAHGITCSMSRTGNCYDNAVMERFGASYKTEEVYRRVYATREQAMARAFNHIGIFYNRQRRHSALGYLSPEAFAAGLN